MKVKITFKQLVRVIGTGVLIFGICAVMAEGVAAIYFHNFSKHFYKPAYLLRNDQLKWRTEYESWGAWHKVNESVRHQSTCFDVKYHSNSLGARDAERDLRSRERRFAFIGDSFIEGFGVDKSKRLSAIFEKETGIEALNFAAAGDFGPVQYYIINNKLVSKFDHTDVVIGFLPSNDFIDNDPSDQAWIGNNEKRYRPYYEKVGDGYRIVYKGKKVIGRTLADLWTDPFGSFLFQEETVFRYTWLYGLRLAIKGQLPAKDIDIGYDASKGGYFEADNKRIEATFYFLKLLINESYPRKVWIVVIPSYQEVKLLRSEQSPWIPKLYTQFKMENVRIVDLTTAFSKLDDISLRKAYQHCDGHWSENGNEIAAKELISAMAVK